LTTIQHAFVPDFVSDSREAPLMALGTRLEVGETGANDGAGDGELPLARLWQELTSGTCTIVTSSFSDTHCYLVTVPAEPNAARPIAARARRILESLLRGCAQKNISYDLALAPSTVTLIAQRALASMGWMSRPSRANPLLMLAARAASEQDETLSGTLAMVIRAGVRLRVVSVTRPELGVVGRLPGAELDIVRSLVEGHSHADIARRRGTAQRTIANQIASVFRRLDVSSRAELIHRLSALSRAGIAGGAQRLAPESCDIANGALG